MNGCQNSVRRSAARRLHGLLASLIVDSVALDVMGRTLFPRSPTDQHRDALVMGVRRRSDSAATLDGYRDTHWLA